MPTMTKTKPPYKIRKHSDGWRLTKYILVGAPLAFDEGFEVESYVGTFRSHPVALVVMDADAVESNYPLFRDLEAC